jgi:hypothetical protein
VLLIALVMAAAFVTALIAMLRTHAPQAVDLSTPETSRR